MTREEEIELAWQRQQQQEQATYWHMRRPPSLSPELRDRLAEAQNWRCCYCGVRMMSEKWNDPTSPTFEHIKRRADGGSMDDLDNIAISCFECNTGRHGTDPFRYAAQRRRRGSHQIRERTEEKRDGHRKAA